MAAETIGNSNLISSEEERLVRYLEENNLAYANKISRPVHPRDGLYVKTGKRILDLAVAIPAFIVFLPLNAVIGVCTFFDVGRPVLFRQTRVGKENKPFIIVKFRNMNERKDKDGILLPPKDRVTKFGKVMRKYSLDELLNFWSVIKGDMSIIGPRPLPVSFVDRMTERHKMRSSVRPGLECPRVLAQDSQVSQYNNQFENDIWYVENVSFLTDCRMVLRLIKMTFNIRKRSHAAEGASYFVGYDENGNATSFKQYLKEHPDFFER